MANPKIITYDLRNAGKNYDGLYEYIKKFPSYARISESTWAVSSVKSCKTIRDELKQVLDSDDCFFVGALTKEAAWKNIIDSAAKLKDTLNQ